MNGILQTTRKQEKLCFKFYTEFQFEFDFQYKIFEVFGSLLDFMLNYLSAISNTVDISRQDKVKLFFTCKMFFDFCSKTNVNVGLV